MTTFTIPRPDWVTSSQTEDRGPYAQFQMYSEDGNNAVAEMILVVIDTFESMTFEAGIGARKAFLNLLQRAIKALASAFPEVHDTEPEWEIVDVVNAYLKSIDLRAEVTRDDLSTW
jgi:hypothetical protein